MNSLFITSNAFFLEGKSGGFLISRRNRDLLRKITNGECYTIFTCGNKNNIPLEKTEIALSVKVNRLQRVLGLFVGRYYMIRPLENELVEFIKDHEIDVVFFDSTYFGITLRRIKEVCKVKTICFMHNVERKYLKKIKKVRNVKDLFFKRAGMCNESLSVKCADVLLAINERDALDTEQFYGRKPDYVLPVSMDDLFRGDVFANSNFLKGCCSLLFVGSNFPPNVDGIRWFIKEVLPELDISLTVVGNDLDLYKDEFESPKVKVLGRVESLTEYYERADAVVEPIFYGSGMKVKTAEAMMYGKIIFATSEALEGYNEPSDDIYRCDSKESFLLAIREFICDKKVFSYRNRQIWEQNYDSRIYQSKLADIVNRVLGKTR